MTSLSQCSSKSRSAVRRKLFLIVIKYHESSVTNTIFVTNAKTVLSCSRNAKTKKNSFLEQCLYYLCVYQ